MRDTAGSALDGIRVCDLSGQLAGAGATRTLAAFGAEVIRVEDPVRKGRWDLLRGIHPFVDSRRGIELGGAFNNHNVDKLGVTINTRTDRGRALLADLIQASDVVTENFSAGILESWGLGYRQLRELKPDIIYVSNCGFGHTGPYASYKTWGPIVQAVCGLTFSSGLPGQPLAGLGYSYMDHHGANLMTFAVLAALYHRGRTGEGQWIDMSCVEAGAALLGPAVLDWSVNSRPSRRDDKPDGNHNRSPLMVPHGIYPAAGDDEWVALACRTDADWIALAAEIGERWADEPAWSTVAGRLKGETTLDERVAGWTGSQGKFDVQRRLLAAGVPCRAVQKPPERIDQDSATADWGLWPAVEHAEIGTVQVDGLPVHLSATDWRMERGAPLLGEHNGYVLGRILGLSAEQISQLEADDVI